MKPEQSERFFVESLFKKTIDNKKIDLCSITEIEKLTGDASTRRYYRVETSSNPYVVCLDDPVVEMKSSSPFVLVHRAFTDNNVRVPVIYDRNLEKGYFLEEDLGDVTLLRRLAETKDVDEELQLYTTCIDELLKIHRIDCDKYSDEIFTKLAFDEEKLMSEVLFTVKFFIKRFLKCEMTIEDEAVVVSTYLNICRKLESKDRVLTHRDYHSRNIMIHNNDMVVIDFQDARMGIPQYDLVSLLEDCYYDLDTENVEKLKKYYWDNFELQGSFDNSYKEFEYYYDLMALQRVFKAIGSFGYIYAGRKDLRYVKYIGFGFEKLRRIMFKYSEFTEMRQILTRIYYEN